jgi:hypothetical protein
VQSPQGHESMARFLDRRLARIFATIGKAEPATYTCGVCGFVMNEVGGSEVQADRARADRRVGGHRRGAECA